MATATLKRSTARKSRIKKASKKISTRKLPVSYDDVKFHNGQQYTGMSIGRSHKWYYDKGDWRETKITPDLWEISYHVTKRRAGHAPEGSGVPTGTEYHWYILAHQNVRKLNKDDYSTELTGLKFKVAHKRAIRDTWSSSSAAQRKRLVKFLQEMIRDLEIEPVILDFEYKEQKFKGEAMPISLSCREKVCLEFAVSLNNRHLGIIKHLKSGWKMDNAPDPKLINAIGKEIESVRNK
jgi:hypothetical protein